jgi:hypothetical protein
MSVGQDGREHLLDGQIEHRLLGGGELDGPLAQAADGRRNGQRPSLSGPGPVGVHAHRGDESDALLVAAPHLGAEHAGGDHGQVAARVEPVEGQGVAAGHDGEPVVRTGEGEPRDDVVGHQEADHVGGRGRFDIGGGEALGLGLLPRLVGPDAHGRVEPGVPQVQGPGAPLVAVADHGQRLALQRRPVGVVLVVDRRHRRGI